MGGRRCIISTMALVNFRATIDDFAKGKLWHWHIPLWLFGLYVFIKMFEFNMGGTIPGVLLVPYWFDFMVHEFAHVFAGPMPPIVAAAAGSFSELVIGVGLVVGALLLRNFFALLFCLLWFDLVLQSIGTYMADAVPRQLPLVSLGGAFTGQDATHDWHFIFGELGMLGASGLIGGSLRALGHLVGLFGLVFAAWLIYKMAVVNKQKVAAPAAPAPKPKAAFPSTQASRPATNSVYPEATRGDLATRKPLDDPDQH